MQTSPKEGLGNAELPENWSVSYVLPETSRHTTHAHPTTPRSPEDQGYALGLFEFSEHESEDTPHPAFRISMITEGEYEEGESEGYPTSPTDPHALLIEPASPPKALATLPRMEVDLPEM